MRRRTTQNTRRSRARTPNAFSSGDAKRVTFAVQFSPNAERDFLRAQSYYDEVAPNQTDRFIATVFVAARVLINHHDIGRIVSGDVRRWHIDAFPPPPRQ